MKLYPLQSGVHSIPAMHTTHKHIEGFYGECDTLRASWRYVTGMDDPHYPVPAIREKNMDGLAGCFHRYGATFIDWSRGYLEVY